MLLRCRMGAIGFLRFPVGDKKLNNAYSASWTRLALLLQDAILAYDKCLEIQPDSRNAGQNRLLALNYAYPGEDPMVCSEHSRWGDDFQSQFDELPSLTAEERSADKKLVVGYMSPDFFTHSVSYFAEAPLTHHNPERLLFQLNDCA